MLYLMANHEIITADQLAEYFEVSKRTILRDLDSLLGAGFPIECVRGRKGGFCLNRNYILNTTILTKSQTQTLSSLVQTLKLLPDNDGQLFETMFSHEDWFEYDFSSWSHTDRKLFSFIREHIQDRSPISFIYYNSSGEKGIRTVLPEKLIYKDRFWYLKALDVKKQADRMFKLRRIVLEDSDSDSEIVNGILIKMELHKNYIFKVLDECLVHSIEIQKNDISLVTFSCPRGQWIVDFILSFGEYGRVIEPVSLKEEILQRINRMSQIYS